MLEVILIISRIIFITLIYAIPVLLSLFSSPQSVLFIINLNILVTLFGKSAHPELSLDYAFLFDS